MTAATITSLSAPSTQFRLREGDPTECVVRFYAVQPESLDQFVEETALAIADCFFAPLERARLPDMTAADLLPPRDDLNDNRVRKGDFGEVLSHVLYRQVGFEVPFSKLWNKPRPGTTQTGADTVAIAVRPPTGTKSAAERSTPIVIEAKVRTSYNSPARLLGFFDGADDPEVFASAARVGLNSLAAHPDERNSYAYLTAHAYARQQECRIHVEQNLEHHGLLIVEPGCLTQQQITERWGDNGLAPPRSRLTVLSIPDLESTIHRCFDRAMALRVRDVVGLVDAGEPVSRPGLSTPVQVSLDQPFPAAASMPALIAEVALWFLADRDGLASARSQEIIDCPTPEWSGTLRRLLGGELSPASTPPDLQVLVSTIERCWRAPGELVTDRGEIEQSLAELSKEMPSEWIIPTQLAAQAIAYRLHRHPHRITRPVDGTHLLHVVQKMVHTGRVALWPPQHRALVAGLLDSGPRPFIVNSPTSSGKTPLIVLSCASALDQQNGKQVVVVADKRALVKQLRDEIRYWLPPHIEVTALTGEIEHGSVVAFPTTGPKPRVLVTTPERFDLDWRRASTEPGGLLPGSHTSLIIADEAHHIGDRGRGARLELVLARAMRHDIPVQLFSSQLAGLEKLGSWVGHEAPLYESWSAAPIERFVFYRNDDDRKGYLWAEYGDPAPRVELAKVGKKGQLLKANRSVAELAAELADKEYSSNKGLVLLFSAKRSLVDGLAASIHERCSDDGWEPQEELIQLADRLPDESAQIANLLVAGIGLHHGSGTKFEHNAVETAARNGWLRFLATTPTLISGIDFPVRTVIAAYPGRGRGADATMQMSELSNLQGRAGRGGNFTQGTLIIMVADRSAASKVKGQFQHGQLPASTSQLARISTVLGRVASKIDLTGADIEQLRDFDTTVLGVLVDAAVEEADLRHEIEKILEHTLFFVGMETDERVRVLDAAVERAKYFRALPDGWSRVVYRTGLGIQSCNALYQHLNNVDRSPFVQVAITGISSAAPGDLLTILATAAVETPAILTDWTSAPRDAAERAAVVAAWLDGATADSIADLSEPVVQRGFDRLSGLGKWVVGAAIDVVCWIEKLDRSAVQVLHQALGLERLRTGTVSTPAADLAERGVGRERANELWETWRRSAALNTPFDDFLTSELSVKERALLDL